MTEKISIRQPEPVDDEERSKASSSSTSDVTNDHGKETDADADYVWPITNVSFPREALIVIVVCMAQFCTQAAFLSTLFLLRKIGNTFGITDPLRLAWLVAGYSLTVGTFILLSGRLGDMFGYKKMFIIGLVWFSVWSMVAGLSAYSNFTLAVFSRVLQGIGPAICLPNALAVFGVMYPPGHRKAMVFAFFGAVAPIGAVIGCAVATALDLIWWPWALWAMAIWLAILAVITYFAIPTLPKGDISKGNGEKRGMKYWCTKLDLPGAVIGITALILFNFAFTQSPLSGWDTPTTLVPLILGLLLFLVFLYIEFKISPQPLLPYDAVNSDVAFVLGAVCCGWASFGIWTLYLVQMLQDIRGLNPLLTTAYFSPVTVSGAVAAVFTGKMLGPWKVRPPVVMVMALCCFTTGSALTATVPQHQIYWAQIFVATIIMPWGMDSSFPAATLILSDAASKEAQGVAASLVNTVVNYGIALGVGFAGIVETNIHAKGDDSVEARLDGYRGGLYMGIGMAGLGVIISVTFLAKDTFWRKK